MADLTSTPGPVGFPPELWAKFCRHTDVAAPDSWLNFTLIGLHLHPSDRCSGRSFRSWRDRLLLRCGVLPALGTVITPAILLRVLPGPAGKTLCRNVIGRFGIGLAVAFALLVFVFFLLIFAAFAFLAFVFTLLVTFTFLVLAFRTASRDPWVRHHQRPYQLVLGGNQNSIGLTCAQHQDV